MPALSLWRFSDEAKRRFVEGIERGLAISWAARYAGVSIGTWTTYRMRAEESIAKGVSDEYTEFYYRVATAEAEFVLRETSKIVRHGERTWLASAWLLERRFPKDFGQRQVMEITGTDGEPIRVSMSSESLKQLSTDELLVLDSALRKLRQSDGQSALESPVTIDGISTEARSDPS